MGALGPAAERRAGRRVPRLPLITGREPLRMQLIASVNGPLAPIMTGLAGEAAAHGVTSLPPMDTVTNPICPAWFVMKSSAACAWLSPLGTVPAVPVMAGGP